MEQPWWVYAVIALVCAILYLVVKVIESRVPNEKFDFDIFNLIIALVGFFAVYQAADAIALFG